MYSYLIPFTTSDVLSNKKNDWRKRETNWGKYMNNNGWVIWYLVIASWDYHIALNFCKLYILHFWRKLMDCKNFIHENNSTVCRLPYVSIFYGMWKFRAIQYWIYDYVCEIVVKFKYNAITNSTQIEIKIHYWYS